MAPKRPLIERSTSAESAKSGDEDSDAPKAPTKPVSKSEGGELAEFAKRVGPAAKKLKKEEEEARWPSAPKAPAKPLAVKARGRTEDEAKAPKSKSSTKALIERSSSAESAKSGDEDLDPPKAPTQNELASKAGG